MNWSVRWQRNPVEDFGKQELYWDQGSSPVIAGGILYAAREDGVVFAAKVGEKFELLSENQMGEQILASPVPFDGKMLLRGEGHFFCIE